MLLRKSAVFALMGVVIPILTLLATLPAATARATPALPGDTPVWTVECIDCPRYFEEPTNRSLRLDGADRPHLAYGGDALYHASDAGSGWQIETVDSSPGVGSYASMSIFSDTIAIAYHDIHNADLKVAQRIGGVWQVETVDSAGAVGSHTSTAFDSQGGLHVAYFDVTNGDLKYALWNGASWNIQTVESLSTSGTFASLAIGANDRPHISYIQYLAGDPNPYVVRYAAFDGATWQFANAENGPVPLAYTSLALDADNRPVIAYQNQQNGVLHITQRDAGGAWNDVAVTPAGDANNGAWPSLVIGANGQFHVAYQGTSQARYAYTDPVSGAWQLTQVESTLYSGAYSSLTLDTQGAPHIAYGFNGFYNGDLRYARLSQSTWQIETVDHREIAGSRASLTIDPNGLAHVAYKVDYSGRSLRYTVQSPTGWLSSTIDLRMVGFAGDFPSIRTDAGYQPRISYYGGTYGGLRAIELTGTAWVSTTIAGDLQANMTGRNTSLALAADGTPHIGYAGVTQPAYISYATRAGSAWQTQNVDFGGCGYTALALTDAAQPRMAYCAGNTVRYAAWNGATWAKSSVITSTAPPAHIDMVLDSAGTPHISYQDTAATNLRYATRQGSTWITETVDAEANTGQYSAVAVNLSGTVFISYYDQGRKNLNLAQRSPAGWVTQTVASDVGVLSAKTTVAVAPSGAIGIAYYDAWRHDLKLAATGVFTSGGGGGGGGGGGTVTDCSSAADFLAKVAGGGTVFFACDGLLAIPALAITATTTISAAGHNVTLSGDNANRLFTVQPGVGLSLHSLKLTDGSVDDEGGLLRIEPGAAVTITQSTLARGAALAGGALFNDGGRLYVENSTFSANHATAASAAQGGGGAIFQAQRGATAPVATLRYSTFHSNTVAAGNTAAGGIYPLAGAITVDATILDDPTPCTLDGANPGGLISTGYNLERSDSCGLDQTTDLTNTNALLGPLGFGQNPVTGSLVLVHVPAFNSPAVDSIPAAQCTVAVDQENESRPQEGNGTPPATCDRGSIERIDTELVQVAPLIVNSASDGDDGRCTIGHCTLREAIVQANATVTTSTQTIGFNFGDAAQHAVVITAPLPGIAVPAVVDGLTAPGASCTAWPPALQVVVSGSGAGAAANGLHLLADNSGVRGLVIAGFGGAGVRIDGDRSRVECNYIGSNAAGTAAVANGVGVEVRGGVSNTIGGATTGARNLIAGNTRAGISVAAGDGGEPGRFNHIQGNLIGVQADGVSPLGNGSDGILFDASTLRAVESNLVGGDTPATANTIAFNGRNGVTIFCCDQNRITANTIYSNAGQGIDLAGADRVLGVTANDLADPDVGGNRLQNFPVISAAVSISGQAKITVTLNSVAGSTYRIELFTNDRCDASGYGEGKTRVDAADVATDSSGNATSVRTLAGIPVGAIVTATATKLEPAAADGVVYGDTSEFSACYTVTSSPVNPGDRKLFLPLTIRS